MRVVALLLVAATVLAGCSSQTETRSDRSCVNGVCEDRSLACTDDGCEVCVDGNCVACERDACDACYDRGECPAGLMPDANATFPDFTHQQTYGLTQGLAQTAWVFDSAVGSTGHVQIILRDPVTKQAVVMGGVCFSYDVTTWDNASYSRNSGNRGSCGNTVPVGGSTTNSAMVLADLGIDRRGHYKFTLQADPQANELFVDIVVDNP